MFSATQMMQGRGAAAAAPETIHSMTFADLGLSETVLKAVTEAGYVKPTPIQEQAIPYVLMGRDVLGTAQTGTGKTAGFTLPMIDILAGGRARARMPRALILEPTRELADQVSNSFETYGKHNKLSMALLIGGVSFADQERKLDRGVDVLVATPGRLLDHFERGKVMLGGVQILVIDEADRMMDMGFMPDVERIVRLLPTIRQTLFFSATMPPEMRKLADQFLSNPKEVAVSPPASPAETVIQGLVRVGAREKRDALRRLIGAEDVKNAIIFCNRKRDVDILAKSLQKYRFNAAPLHGDMAQAARMETLARFKGGELTLLVASDVAARGLDVQGLSHVFNFDVPSHAEDYVHRIGRTGRAGLTGHAYTLATPEDGKYLAAIVAMLGKPIPELKDMGPAAAAATAEAAEPHAPADRPRRERGRSRGERKPRDHKHDERKHAEPQSKAAPEAAPQAEREPAPVHVLPRREPRHEPRHEPDRKVVGLGDHVPAFLMRPVRRREAAG